MTEITTWTPTEAPAASAFVDYQTRAVANLRDWAESANAAYVVAERLVQSSFVPAQFKGKPIEASAAILAGMEIGLSPMSALKAFDVISGQSAPRAITLRAVVQSHGHEIVLVESTATMCVMRGRRRGTSEWQQVRWTIDRARDLGLLGKDNWKKQPGAMLVARATSEIARLVAADAILGIGYSAEEISDGAGGSDFTVQAVPEPPAAPERTRRFSRPAKAAKPAPVEQPAEAAPGSEPVDAEVVEDAAPAETGEAITDAQQRALWPAFNAAGFDTDARTTEGRQARLDYINSVLTSAGLLGEGEPIASTRDMTKAQASVILDALRQDAADLNGGDLA